MATHVGTNHIQLPVTSSHPRIPTASDIQGCTNHTQLPQPNTWVPITYNDHGHTRGHQTHPTVTAIHVGANHIQPLLPHAATNHIQTSTGKHWDTNNFQLPPPYTWEPTTFICHRHTRRQRTTPNCHRHTRWHQPHPTGTTKLVGTNHIQLPQPHTWAPNTFNCHRQTRGGQSYPTATATRVGPQPHPTAAATHAGTNHIQLASPNSWVPITSNVHGHTPGHQTHSTVTAIHVDPTISNRLPPHE